MSTERYVARSQVLGARSAGEDFVNSRAFEILARAGFVARGLVWGIIGALALELAVGWGGKITNQQGALHTVAHQPGGHILLTLVAIGLGGYSLWRFVRAALGHGPEGADGGFDRLAAAASGIAYAIVFALGVEILLGSGGSSSSHSPKLAAAGVLAWPAGRWLVSAAGFAMLGVAFYQGHRGLTKKFLDDTKVNEMSPLTRTWITIIGTVGLVARMVVFGLIGIFLVKAAIEYDPQQAVGLDGALAKIVNASYGPLLLGIVAAGLIAFALYSLSDARYRKI